MISKTLSITSAAVLIALSGAQAAEVDRGQQVAVGLGLPAVRVSWEKQIGTAFRLGIEIAAEQLNRGENLSLTSIGIRLPARWDVAKAGKSASERDVLRFHLRCSSLLPSRSELPDPAGWRAVL